MHVESIVLEARRISAKLVVARLHLIEAVRLLGLVRTRLLDRSFHRPQVGQSSLHAQLAITGGLVAIRGLGLEITHPESQQLGAELALFIFQHLEAPRDAAWRCR